MQETGRPLLTSLRLDLQQLLDFAAPQLERVIKLSNLDIALLVDDSQPVLLAPDEPAHELLPESSNRFGLLLRRNHDLGESPPLLEHREHASRELAARFDLQTSLAREHFDLAPIEAMHAVAIGI